MKNIEELTNAEMEIYCWLLPFAYKLLIEQTGLVCGTKSEELRDKMFKAIMKVI